MARCFRVQPGTKADTAALINARDPSSASDTPRLRLRQKRRHQYADRSAAPPMCYSRTADSSTEMGTSARVACAGALDVVRFRRNRPSFTQDSQCGPTSHCDSGCNTPAVSMTLQIIQTKENATLRSLGHRACDRLKLVDRTTPSGQDVCWSRR